MGMVKNNEQNLMEIIECQVAILTHIWNNNLFKYMAYCVNQI